MKRLFIVFTLFFPVFTLAADVATTEQSDSDSSESEEDGDGVDGDIPMVDLPDQEELEQACRQFCGESTWQDFWDLCKTHNREMHEYFTLCLKNRTTLTATEKNAIEVLLRALSRSQVE